LGIVQFQILLLCCSTLTSAFRRSAANVVPIHRRRGADTARGAWGVGLRRNAARGGGGCRKMKRISTYWPSVFDATCAPVHCSCSVRCMCPWRTSQTRARPPARPRGAKHKHTPNTQPPTPARLTLTVTVHLVRCLADCFVVHVQPKSLLLLVAISCSQVVHIHIHNVFSDVRR
jgi:hypothetical protein